MNLAEEENSMTTSQTSRPTGWPKRSPDPDPRENLIKVAKSPWGILALIVVVLDGIMFILAATSPVEYRPTMFYVAAVIMGLSIVAVVIMFVISNGKPKK